MDDPQLKVMAPDLLSFLTFKRAIAHQVGRCDKGVAGCRLMDGAQVQDAVPNVPHGPDLRLKTKEKGRGCL